MISLLIGIIILLVIVYVARLVIGEFGLPPTITKLIYLAIGLIAFFYFLDLIGVYHFALK